MSLSWVRSTNLCSACCQVEAAAFQLLVTYVYTGRMDVPHEHLPTVTLLARHFGLDYLESQLTRKLREKKSFGLFISLYPTNTTGFRRSSALVSNSHVDVSPDMYCSYSRRRAL